MIAAEGLNAGKLRAEWKDFRNGMANKLVSLIAATSFSFNLNLNSINQKEIQNVLDWIQIRLI